MDRQNAALTYKFQTTISSVWLAGCPIAYHFLLYLSFFSFAVLPLSLLYFTHSLSLVSLAGSLAGLCDKISTRCLGRTACNGKPQSSVATCVLQPEPVQRSHELLKMAGCGRSHKRRHFWNSEFPERGRS